MLDQLSGDSFRVVAGNTGAGVYHDWPLERVLVDIKAIPELTTIKYSQVGHGSRPYQAGIHRSLIYV